jgi:hypothetical protein
MEEEIFTPDERKQFEALAHQWGFKSLREYVLTYIRQDIQQHGESVEVNADDELDDPIESIKQGWADVREGRVMSHEEFVRRMNEDAD